MATKSERFKRKYYNAEMVQKPQVLVIDHEDVEEIADPKTGKTTEKSVLVFEGTTTRLVLNTTNWDTLAELTGSGESADWSGHTVELYCDKTRFGSEVKDCVRIRMPALKKLKKAKPAAPKPEEEEEDFNAGAAEPLADEGAATVKAKGNGDLDDDIPF
jgi:hypothetical protein